MEISNKRAGYEQGPCSRGRECVDQIVAQKMFVEIHQQKDKKLLDAFMLKFTGRLIGYLEDIWCEMLYSL